MSFESRGEQRAEQLYERSNLIAESLTQLCLGRPVDVSVQALGVALIDALQREHPLPTDEVLRMRDRSRQAIEIALFKPEGIYREDVLNLLHELAFSITLASAAINAGNAR